MKIADMLLSYYVSPISFVGQDGFLAIFQWGIKCRIFS